MPEHVQDWAKREYGVVLPSYAEWDDAPLIALCEEHGLEWIQGSCLVGCEMACPSQDEFAVGDRVRGIVSVSDRMPPYTGIITAILEDYLRYEGHSRFKVLVDGDYIGLDFLVPCACRIRKIEMLPDYELPANPVMDKLRNSFPKAQFFGTIKDVIESLD